MDLKKYDTSSLADSGAEMQLLDPYTGVTIKDDETGEPIVFKVLGQDSGAAKAAMQKITNRRQGRASKRRPTIQEAEENGAELLAALTVSWKPRLELDGEELECNAENAKMVYLQFPWIKEQVDEFVADRANFMPGGSKK